MKTIRTEDAVGHVLCHDLTQIIPGEYKDARFRKGHIVTEEDIPVLLSMGKETLFVWEKTPGMLHENEAAERLADLCGTEHFVRSAVKEGKIELTADCDGLLKVDTARLKAVNGAGEVMIASRHGNTPVKKGDKILGTRVIPLVIAEEKLQKAEQAAGDQPLERRAGAAPPAAVPLDALPSASCCHRSHRQRGGKGTDRGQILAGRTE